MPGSGTSTVDFGAFPGTTDTTVAVTGQTNIGGASVVGAWIWPVDTVEHSADEHRVEEIDFVADTVVAGTGFTIFAKTRGLPLYGRFNVAWAWA